MKKVALAAFAVCAGLVTLAAGKGMIYRTVRAPSSLKEFLQEARAATPTPLQLARTNQAIAEDFRYKGVKVITSKALNAEDPMIKRICSLLSKADFVPEVRSLRFAELSSKGYTITGWQLMVERVDVREEDSLVRVHVAPTVMALGEGIIGVMSSYGENYQLANGELHFLGGDSIDGDTGIAISVQ